MKVLYTVEGVVKDGAKRGRDLGFPTANIAITAPIPEGIYASEVMFDSHTYIAATFIGKAVTFGETEYKAETYIIDFNKDIYGETLTIKLFKKIRENVKFSGEKQLIEQMNQDIVDIKKYFMQSEFKL